MLQITKMNTKQHTNTDKDVFDIEIWFKIKNQRRRIDLSVRILSDSDEDEELYVFNSAINVSAYQQMQIKYFTFCQF